jgi:hypothetical protein
LNSNSFGGSKKVIFATVTNSFEFVRVDGFFHQRDWFSISTAALQYQEVYLKDEI